MKGERIILYMSNYIKSNEEFRYEFIRLFFDNVMVKTGMLTIEFNIVNDEEGKFYLKICNNLSGKIYSCDIWKDEVLSKILSLEEIVNRFIEMSLA